MLNIVDNELEQGTAPARIGYFSFTRKAANEARERAVVKFPELNADLDFPWFRTLHSLAYRCLDVSQKDMMTPEHFAAFAKESGIVVNTEIGEESYVVRTDHPILNEINIARIRGEDLRTYYNRSELRIEWYHFEYVERCYRHYKQRNNLLDFTDLLEKILLEPNRLPRLDMTIIDEAQDLSRLQWRLVNALAERSNQMYIAGDDDQCQPAGTKVLTTEGHVEIQDLDPSFHRLICYDRNGSSLVGRKEGYSFTKASRLFSGTMLEVLTERGNNRSQYTHNHHCIVRWKPYEMVKHLRVVYLMQRGSRFRIGQCQLFRADGCVHAWVRAHLEKAQRMWFLAVVDTMHESSYLENLFSYGYGIPQMVFEHAGAQLAMSQEGLDKLFDELATENPAKRLLMDKGLSFNHPLYDREVVSKRRGGSQIFEVHAINLLPEAMLLPELNEKKLVWSAFTLEKRFTREMVYSLDVQKHHNYFADEILTHNCIYNWAGADVGSFLSLPGEIKILEQSYRVPAKIHQLADKVVRRIRKRQPKVWNPRQEQGLIQYYNNFTDVDVTKGEWLVLAATNYMLNGMHEWLKSQGLLFERNGQKSIPAVILSAVLGWEALRKGKEVPFSVVRQIYKYLNNDFIKRGHKSLPKADPEIFYDLPRLTAHHGLLTNAIWHKALTKISEEQRDYIVALLRRKTSLKADALIKLSTIHGAKGGEADNVLLITDLSSKFAREYDKNPDDIHRLLYVGITRAKQSLHVVLPKDMRKGFML